MIKDIKPIFWGVRCKFASYSIFSLIQSMLKNAHTQNFLTFNVYIYGIFHPKFHAFGWLPSKFIAILERWMKDKILSVKIVKYEIHYKIKRFLSF